MGKSWSHSARSMNLRRYKQNEIIKEIREDQGPLAHSASLRTVRTQMILTDDDLPSFDEAENSNQKCSLPRRFASSVDKQDTSLEISDGDPKGRPAVAKLSSFKLVDVEAPEKHSERQGRNLQDFKVFDSAKEKPERQASRFASLLDYVFGWKGGDTSPREGGGAAVQMSGVQTVHDGEQSADGLETGDGGPSQR